MNMFLSKTPIKFLEWWALKAPRRIFTVATRFLLMLNNQLSFTVNLRLIFTPLFGDYTWIGRLVGFVVRTVEVTFGLLIVGVLAIITVLSPVIWWLLPVILYLITGVLVLILIPITYFLWWFNTKDIPDKKLSEINDENEIMQACTPLAATYLSKTKINPKETLKEMLTLPDVLFVLTKAEISKETFLQKLSDVINVFTEKIEKTAVDLAKSYNSKYLEIEYVFLSTLTNIDKADVFLAALGSNLKSVGECVKWLTENKNRNSALYLWQEDYHSLFSGGIGKGMTGRVTPLLDSMSRDFTKMVQQGKIKQIVDREQEIEKVAQILQSEKSNLLIIGEPGSGKTSIVQGVAYEIIAGTKYDSLRNKRIVSLEIGNLIAGTKTSGEIADRITKIMSEIGSSGNIILFIDEIHNLLSGSEDEADASSVYSTLEPYISGNTMQFIGATSIPNYRKYVEPNGSFSRLFQTVEIPEASKTDTLQILKVLAAGLEAKYKLVITYKALDKIVELSERLIHERVLPDKAIDILNRSVTLVTEPKLLTAEIVAKEISEMTHVPVDNLSEDESKKLLNIETEMKKDVIGQDKAIDQIGSALKRARVGIRNQGKPIASFLFVGTTGVGKTQTAKALAKNYFGNKDTMIRLDMSEYQQLDSMSRLIGTPDGSTKGILTEKVRTSPFALILLDEIEKAHQNILLTFLQVLDDGRLTDSSGIVVDFTNTIIIATSNTGTRAIQKIMQENGTIEKMAETAMLEVREKFAPEFLNRFTGIIVFNPLNHEDIKKISLLLMNDVIKMAEEKGIKLKFKDELLEELVKKGFNSEWGARPLARLIEDTVESYLAEKILSGGMKQGDEVELGLEVFNKTA